MEKEKERKHPRGREGKKLLFLAFLIATCAAFLAGLSDIQDFDIWYHLKTGEIILSEQHIPSTDVFSYTASGKPWIVHEWLSEVIFFLVHQAFGAGGLVFLKALILAASAGLVLSLSLRGRSTSLPFLLFPLFLFPITLRAFERPDIFTLLFTCVLLLLLFRYKEEKTGRSLYLLPLLFLVWANLHSGVTLGLLLFAAFVLGGELTRRFSKKGDDILQAEHTRFLFRVFLLSLAASLLNPFHVKALFYPFWLARNPVFTKTIGELKGPLDPEYTWAFWQVGFLAIIPITLAVIILTRRAKDFFLILPLGFSLLLSFFAHRNVPMFAAIALAVTATSTARAIQGKRDKGHSFPAMLPRVEHIMACIVPALAAVLLLTKGAYMGKDGWRPVGTQVREAHFPRGAVEFLEEQDIGGHMFNMMGWGGYLIYRGYPERKVFMDGRLDLYGEEFSRKYLDAYFGSVGVEQLAEEYDIGYFILDYPDVTDPRLIQYSLAGNRKWALVYWDDNSLVYVKNDSTYRRIVDELGYKSVNPIYRAASQVLQQAKKNPEGFIAEVERQLAARPGTAISQVFLGTGYEAIGEITKALAHYEKALAADPGREDLRNKVFMLRVQEEGRQKHRKEVPLEEAPSALAEGVALLQQARYEEAKKALLRAIKESPDDANAFYNLALAYRQLGDRPEARKYLDRALALNPGHADAHNDLGIMYAMDGNYDAAIRHFQQALSTDPRRIPTLMNLTLTQEKAGDTAKAVATLDRILQIEPDNQKAKAKLDALVGEAAGGPKTEIP